MLNLPASMQSEAQFESFCSEYGAVEAINFLHTKHVGVPVYHLRGDAEKAFKGLNGRMIEGRLIQCNWAKMKTDGVGVVTGESRNIRVNNLPASLRIESAFERLCGRFGPVESVIILKTGPVGFCQFATHEAAQRAMAGLNGLQTDGSTLRVAWGENKEQPQKVVGKKVRTKSR
jgi:RNA recognition motif-containing protein